MNITINRPIIIQPPSTVTITMTEAQAKFLTNMVGAMSPNDMVKTANRSSVVVYSKKQAVFTINDAVNFANDFYEGMYAALYPKEIS